MTFLLVALAVFAPTVDELAARAEAAFTEEDYDAVTAALREAQAIDPRPGFVYGLAQADRLGGRCAAAMDGYAAYLALDPPAAPAEQARLGIAECRAILGAREQALELARSGEVDAARSVLTDLQRERDLVDVPELALALVEVERVAGRCDAARKALADLDRLHIKAEVRAFAGEQVERCQTGNNAPPSPRVEPATIPAAPVRPVSPRRPWHRDPLAGALAGFGAANVAIGIGLLVGAIRVQRDAADAADESAFAGRRTHARRLHVVGWSALAVGSALVIGSVARWGWLARHAGSRRAAARR